MMNTLITVSILQNISPYVKEDDAEVVARIFNERSKEFGITSNLRVAAFLATIIHESGSFRYKQEIASGKAYEGRKDLGNVKPGDGVKYKGRGFIQITGRSNYEEIGNALHIPAIDHPDVLEEFPLCLVSAMWWWNEHGCNKLADMDDMKKVTARVNGGLNGINEREKFYKLAKFYLM